MQVLGYPLTWPTTCFITQGCNASVYGHTNGYGDFVLFDDLGPPWPIHDCYLNRLVTSTTAATRFTSVRTVNTSNYLIPQIQALSSKNTDIKNIVRVAPEDLLGQDELNIAGYVQDYIERQVDKLSVSFGAFGHRVFMNALGNARSQLTIITNELKSYTIFADLSQTVVQRKDLIMARIRSIPLIGISDHQAVLIATDLLLIHKS